MDYSTSRRAERAGAERFTPDETPVFPDGVPAYGAEFITEGYIYPEGMLNGSNGVKADGSPEFPNRVIGRWYCRGWHVGEGFNQSNGVGLRYELRVMTR